MKAEGDASKLGLMGKLRILSTIEVGESVLFNNS